MTFRRASFLLFINWILITTWMISSFESTDATIVVLVGRGTREEGVFFLFFL